MPFKSQIKCYHLKTKLSICPHEFKAVYDDWVTLDFEPCVCNCERDVFLTPLTSAMFVHTCICNESIVKPDLTKSWSENLSKPDTYKIIHISFNDFEPW